MLPLESAATLQKGEVGVQLEGAEHGAILGVSAGSGTVRVRYGLDGETDAAIEGSILAIQNDDVPNSNPDVFTMRLGVKRQLAPWFSVTGGLGGGGSAGGGFFSPDAGFVLAYENPYFVPLFTARVGCSVPFDRQLVVVDEGSPGVLPPLTVNAGGTMGFRIPLSPAAETSGHNRASFLAGLGVTSFWYGGGTESPQAVVSLALGGEVVF